MFKFLSSSLGKKYVMALSGLGLIGFVIAHMLGNLQIFIGPHAINGYAQKLKDLGPLLWVARIGLIGMVLAHVVTSIQLKLENQRARPVKYTNLSTIKATFTSRTMALTGLVIFAYIGFHLAHFTFLCTNPEFADLRTVNGHHDVYTMMIAAFRDPIVSASYIFAMFCLAAHLFHAASSVFQTLGLNTPKFAPLTKLFGPILAALVFFGFGIIPFCVWVGCLK